MEQTKTLCENCGYKLKPHWLFCVSCGSNLATFQPIRCTQCYHTIDDPEPKYCPYCQYPVSEIKPIIQEEAITVPTIQKPEKHVPIELAISDEKVTVKRIVSNLKFNREATIGIVNSKSFSFVALVLIVLVGVAYALSAYFLDWIFTKGATFRPDLYIGGAIFQCSILIAIGFFGNVISSILQVKTSNFHFLRLMGSYAPLFIVKDLVILPLILYINYFQPSRGYSQASNILTTATLIIFVIIFIHFLIFTRAITQTGAAISFLLASLTFIMAFAFVTGYVIPMIQLFYDLFAS